MKCIYLTITILIVSTVDYTYACKCAVPKPGDEVCGSDGRTYRNGCELFCSTINRSPDEFCLTQVHAGKCSDSPCVCEESCDYMCGSDGRNYGNECTMNCAQQFTTCLQKVKNGKCGHCDCTPEENPICGSDCVSYTNDCTFECRQEVDLFLHKLHDGECKEECVAREPPKCECSNQCEPVCGSNGRTYDNECKLQCAQQIESYLKKVNDGVCGQ